MAFPKYCKINSVYMRTDRGLFIEGEWARPEFKYLADCPWVWTEKVDGTNIRIGLDSDDLNDGKRNPRLFRIGGRSDRTQIPATLYEAIGRLDLEPKMREQFPDGDVTLYGEGYGAKIQKGGGNYRQDQGFVLFDVRCGRWWLQRDAVEEVAAALGIGVVPLVCDSSTLRQAVQYIKDTGEDGHRSKWGDFRAEGIVGTPTVPLFGRDGARIIAKVKSKDFDRLRMAAG